ncbi:polysaccharide pyruvyl transferase family protein [Acinetobacter towneri]|uniref:polysaccharide pyruvyl transferase family protein n=1 Tax=Acinetobacter towneri TaxID=202956 RepID=UPI002DBA3BAE|nr:polysaccharide pyruvyl transferase family protein [Acinetobacter towneri]MEB6564907.1 polysaccharide pyruvyl transferase family protein [Acinetobacter towneri]
MNKIVIVNAYGRSNRGDSVLLDECINEVRKIYSNIIISGVVFEGKENMNLIHPDIIWSERIGNNKYKGIVSKILTLFYLIIALVSSFQFCSFFKFLMPKSQRHTFDAIRNSDIVISAPGGYIHDTNFAFYIALFHIWLGIRFGKKSYLAPQSIGPIDHFFSKRVSKSILSKCNLICARESYTYNFLIQDLGLNLNNIVKKTGDSAFWNFEVFRNRSEVFNILKDLSPDFDENKKILGVTVVNWNFPKLKNPLDAKRKYITAMAEIIDFMVDKYDVLPIIFNQVSEDLPMAKLVAKASRSKVIVDPISREPDILRALIAESHIFLGTRFHSCIFSMMASKPTYAIAYLPKTSYILNDLSLSHRYSDINQIDSKSIILQLENDINHLTEASNEIESAVHNYRNNFNRFSDLLKADCNEK